MPCVTVKAKLLNGEISNLGHLLCFESDFKFVLIVDPTDADYNTYDRYDFISC
jgi:hypothetical protein